MELSAAIQKRTTIRQWKPAPVEKAKIEKVLEAGRRAPSWGNTQPWRFIVVQDRAEIEKIGKASGGQVQVTTAPVLIVCCGAINDLSLKQHGASLKQLRDAGVMDMTDEFLDNVLLKSDVFAPYLLGEPMMQVKVSEQLMIAIAFMMLEAVNQGLGTCCAGAITPKEVHKVMNLPDTIFVHTLLVLGYPGEDPKPRPRKDHSKIIFWGKYK
jgi:nitroreductase